MKVQTGTHHRGERTRASVRTPFDLYFHDDKTPVIKTEHRGLRGGRAYTQKAWFWTWKWPWSISGVNDKTKFIMRHAHSFIQSLTNRCRMEAPSQAYLHAPGHPKAFLETRQLPSPIWHLRVWSYPKPTSIESFPDRKQSSGSFSWFKTQQDVGTRGLRFTELKSEHRQENKTSWFLKKNTSVLNKRFLKTGWRKIKKQANKYWWHMSTD